MPFDKESEMYYLVEDWLTTRTSNPCIATTADEKGRKQFNFRWGAKGHTADVLGVYEERNIPHFVGVEVKLKPRDMQADGIPKAQALQTFCHEVYCAMPEKVFGRLPSEEQTELFGILQRNRLGLLLVRQRGESKVSVHVPAEPAVFRPDLYAQAEQVFRDLDKEQLGELEAEFTSRAGDYDYDWARGSWESSTPGRGPVSLDHVDDDNLLGSIILERNEIVERRFFDYETVFRMMRTHSGIQDTLADDIQDVIDNLREVRKNSRFTIEPKLVLEDGHGRAIEVRLSYFDASEKLLFFSILAGSEPWSDCYIGATLPRELVLQSSETEYDVIDAMVQLYDVLMKLVALLEQGPETDD